MKKERLVAKLQKLHEKRLEVSFEEGADSARDREIEALTRNISQVRGGGEGEGEIEREEGGWLMEIGGIVVELLEM